MGTKEAPDRVELLLRGVTEADAGDVIDSPPLEDVVETVAVEGVRRL